jgi:hypothetical protein
MKLESRAPAIAPDQDVSSGSAARAASGDLLINGNQPLGAGSHRLFCLQSFYVGEGNRLVPEDPRDTHIIKKVS